MALYIPHSIFHLARLSYVRPETFGPYYVRMVNFRRHIFFFWQGQNTICLKDKRFGKLHSSDQLNPRHVKPCYPHVVLINMHSSAWQHFQFLKLHKQGQHCLLIDFVLKILTVLLSSLLQHFFLNFKHATLHSLTYGLKAVLLTRVRNFHV